MTRSPENATTLVRPSPLARPRRVPATTDASLTASYGIGPRASSTIGGLPFSSAGQRFGGYFLEAALICVTLGLGWLVWSCLVWSKGQSPAKSLLGMRCVRTDTGRVATWQQMAWREIFGKWLIGGLSLGLAPLVSGFMVLGDSRQAVWDRIASTVVVDDPDGRLLAPTKTPTQA